jgi:zinc protease
MLNRTLAPDFIQVEQINFIKPTINHLDNGIPVYTLFSGKQDLIRLEFIFEQVNWNAEKPLQSIAVKALLNNGTNKYTAKQIAEQIDFYGAFFQTEYGQDQLTVTLYTLNKHLGTVLPIVKDVLSDSIFPQNELDIYIQNQKQRLQINLKKNDIIARKKFANALFGDTIYGTDIQQQHYDEVKRADLLEFFKEAYNPKNCTIIASGNFKEEGLKLINNNFGNSWESKDTTKNTFNFKVNEKQSIYVEKDDSVQSALRLGRIAISRAHADFAGLQVTNTLLGGYFGSRLMANIREDKGYTYGIGSGIASLKHAGYFFISTEVGVDVCSNALAEIYKEINILQTELVGEAELSLVRNYMLGSMLGSLENIFSHAEKFKSIHFNGLGYDYFTNYISTVKNITAEEIRAYAQKYFNPNDFVEVVVGKK